MVGQNILRSGKRTFFFLGGEQNYTKFNKIKLIIQKTSGGKIAARGLRPWPPLVASLLWML